MAEELGVAANARGDSADALPQAAFDFTFVPPSDAAVSARSELQRAEEKVCHAPEAERAVQVRYKYLKPLARHFRRGVGSSTGASARVLATINFHIVRIPRSNSTFFLSLMSSLPLF